MKSEYFEKKRNVTLYQKEYKIYENNNEKEDANNNNAF